MFRHLACLLALTALAGACRRTDSAIQGHVWRYVRDRELSGTVLVAQHGREIYRGAFGPANREHGVPNRTDTRFPVGPMTRVFTALIALRLIERGELRGEGHVRDYLGEYPAVGDQITVEQLLTHTSGIAGDLTDVPADGRAVPPESAKVNEDFYTLTELVPLISARPLAAEPGSHYVDSSDGYVVLGALLERVTGKSFATLVHDEIAGPLGMTGTDFGPQQRLVPGRATGYRETWGGWELGHPRASTPAGGDGGVLSTAGDLLLLDRALSGKQLVSAETKAKLWKPSPSLTAYGWRVRPDPGRRPGALRVQAGGALGGYEALMTRTLDDGILVVVLLNARPMNLRVDDLTDDLIAIVRGQPPTHTPRPSAARQLSAAIRERGATRAIADFDRGARGIDQGELIRLGGYYMTRDPASGIAVLELTAQLFPASAPAYEALGAGYLLAGQRAEATLAYQRALLLDPSNQSTRALLARLR